MGKVLHQQKISFVTVNFRLLVFVQIAVDKLAQVFFRLQVGALQELAKLPDLDARVHLVEPLTDALNHLRLGTVNGILQIGAERHLQLEGMLQF